jgi:hypothetical protein
MKPSGWEQKSLRDFCKEKGVKLVNNGSDIPFGEFVIGWGLASKQPDLNPHKMLTKGEQRNTMAIFGVNVPRTWDNMNEVPYSQYNKLLVVRPQNHKKGKFLFVTHNIGELLCVCNGLEDYYISKYFPKTREIRVYVAGGKVLSVREKVIHGYKGNIQDGDKWRYMKRSEFEDGSVLHDALKQSLLACDALGLDFGAADVMLNDAYALVCEFNTAPSIKGKIVRDKLYLYFKLAEEMRPKWDWKKFKKANSLFWKTKQLEGKYNG